MANNWRRPSDLAFPQEYHKFHARANDGGELVEFTVGDIPESRFEEACRFMIKHFVPHEPKIVVRNSQNDPLVLEDYFQKYMHGIKQKVSIACFKKGSDEFIGVNILEVLGRDDPISEFQSQSKTCRDVINAAHYVLDRSDVFNRHQVDFYLSGTGLAINADYTGRGIATEMIKARMSMLNIFGIRLACSLFSSIGSQKAAIKAGFKEDFVMGYKDLAEINRDWDFSGSDTESYSLLSMKRN